MGAQALADFVHIPRSHGLRLHAAVLEECPLSEQPVLVLNQSSAGFIAALVRRYAR